jgi:hypothetical protein
MAERIIDGTQFNSENIIFSAPKATPQGAKSVNILNKATKTILTLSTPLMLTWGASDYKAEGEEKGNGKFEMSLQFPTAEYQTADTSAFLINIKALEAKIKSDALIYSKEWFGKVHKSSEVVDALWTPMLKYSKDKNTGEPDLTKQPTLKVKLPQWEGVWKSEIYDEDGCKLFPNITNSSATPLDYLKKGSNIMCLIQFGGIWFINGKFSANWKLVQAVVQKPKASLTGQCFIKLKPQDKEKLQAQTVADDGAVVDDHVQSTIVDDSDEEEEEVSASIVSAHVSVAPVVSAATASVATASVATASVVEGEKKKVVKKKVVVAGA